MAPVRMFEKRGQFLLRRGQFQRIHIRGYLVGGVIAPLAFDVRLKNTPGPKNDQVLLGQLGSRSQQHATRSVMDITGQYHPGFNIFYGYLSHRSPDRLGIARIDDRKVSAANCPIYTSIA